MSIGLPLYPPGALDSLYYGKGESCLDDPWWRLYAEGQGISRT